MSTAPDLARLLGGRGPILLDFDGPLCSIFAGYPARDVAAELRALLRDKGIELPNAVAAEPDPLEILRWTGSLSRPDLTRTVEDALCAAELRAVHSASPTPYSREFVVAARQLGRAVAVVSNNSADAVAHYLAEHRLDGHVAPIIGRVYADPKRMKPNPDPILRAVFALGSEPSESLLVGDSLTDIAGARAAGVPVIGYANKPPKVQQFAEAGADAVVTSMAELAAVLVDAVPS